VDTIIECFVHRFLYTNVLNGLPHFTGIGSNNIGRVPMLSGYK